MYRKRGRSHSNCLELRPVLPRSVCSHRFEAINVAMGNNPPVPYSYCVDAHAGIDADIISWEMVRLCTKV